MAEESKSIDFSGIQVCVRARPLNDRERDGGYRNCISFDEATHQVVLSAVDRSTLMQLRGQTAKGYAFDRRFGPEHTSDNIYENCVCHLVDNLFKGYNATVLAYGQTGAGKTLTMSGGKGIYGNSETGIIRRAAEHILQHVKAVRAKEKPGESIAVRAYALELYNEELRDLSSKVQAAVAALDKEGSSKEEGVRIAERPVGKDGRCIPEVVGVNMVEVQDAESLVNFFADCFDNRAVAATKMNDRSSRSHAIYTVLINRTIVDVSDGGDKVRTVKMESRFNLVDLAGSERVKRSGVTGAAFKEAVHINGGLLALGNVIVALSGGQDGPEEGEADKAAALNTAGSAIGAKPPKAKHIPYRDSKLTRLLQDSLGGSALTVLIACISSCEADFEETNSTLKYANRACKIKNTPVANNQLLLEEDLLPLVPQNGANGGSMSMMQMQLLLAEHNKMKEAREKREAEKREKEEKRLAELKALKEAESKTPGYQRLRMAQYDELRKKLVSSHGGKLAKGEIITDETLAGFKKRETSETEGGSDSEHGPSYLRPTSARGASPATGRSSRPSSARLYTNHKARNVNTSSPLDSARSNGTAAPDILVVGGEECADDAEEQQHTGSSSSSYAQRQQCPEVSEYAAATAAAAAAGEALATRQQFREVHEMAVGTDFEDAAADFSSGSYTKQHKDSVASVDEGTCMTPDGAQRIKACYDAAPTGSPTAVAATAGHSWRTSMSRGASAVLIDTDDTAAPGSQQGSETAAVAVSQPQAAGMTGVTRTTPAAVAAAAAAASTVASYAAIHAAAFEVLTFKGAQAEEIPGTAEPQDSTEPQLVPVPTPQLLARFRVNHSDTLAVFRAVSTEDFADVASLLPPNTALPAADKMTYLLARLEVHPYSSEQLCEALDAVATGAVSISTAVGPAVGCLMATFGTSLITDCIFDFEDPEQLSEIGLGQRLELWGLQIPHTSIRPTLSADDSSSRATDRSPSPQHQRASISTPEASAWRSSGSFTQQGAVTTNSPGARRSSIGSSQNAPVVQQQQQQQQQQSTLQQQPGQQQAETVSCWSSTDRLNASIGLMYALCNLAKELGAEAGFCVPRPQLLRRWLQSGVKMKQVSPPTKLIYPPTAHDYAYYKSSTVAYFLVDEVKESLSKVLSMIRQQG